MKIAICISGQARNFKQSYNGLKSYFLDKYDCDVYFHTWKTPNFESTNFGFGNTQYTLTDNDYNDGILRTLAHKIIEKTNKNVSVLGLNDRTAGHHKKVDNLPPDHFKIIKKSISIIQKSKKI